MLIFLRHIQNGFHIGRIKIRGVCFDGCNELRILFDQPMDLRIAAVEIIGIDLAQQPGGGCALFLPQGSLVLLCGLGVVLIMKDPERILPQVFAGIRPSEEKFSLI